MSPPRVTVVIPTFQRRERVTAAVDSVLAQSLPEVEVLVIDDGSTDGTDRRIRERYADDARVRLLCPLHGGVSRARNLGILEARAPLIAFLDSDDRAHTNRLARQSEALHEPPEVDLCVCDAVFVAADGARRGSLHDHKGYRKPGSLEAMFGGAWGVPSTWLMRTQVARGLLFDPDLGYQEDTDFLFRFHQQGHRIRVLEEALIDYLAEDASGEQARLSTQKPEMDHAWTLVHERHWAALPPEARRGIRRPSHIHRRMAKTYERSGARRRAAPHWRAAWVRAPWRARALFRWLRGSLSRDVSSS